MISVLNIANSNGNKFLGLYDYQHVLSSICEGNQWEYEAFKDYIFFNEKCFNIQNRQELVRKLDRKELSINKVQEYASKYKQLKQ